MKSINKRQNSKKNQNTSKYNFENLHIGYIFLIIAALAFVLYFQTMKFEYTGFDDNSIIEPNLELFSSFDNIGKVFLNDAFFQNGNESFYRPLQNVTFLIDSQFSGIQPTAYHFTNLILHILTSFVLFLLLKELNFDTIFSLLTTLLFVSTPVFNQAVAWIPGRGDLLLGLFSILFLFSYLKYLKTGIIQYLLLNIFSFALALLSKESAIVLPFLIFMYIILNYNRESFSRKNILIYVFYAILSILFILLRNYVIVLKTDSSTFGISQLFSNLRVLPEIFTKFIAPFSLSTLPVFSLFNTIAGILLMFVIFWLAYKYLENYKLLIFSGLWYLAFSIPGMMYSNPFGINGYNYLEHRAYLPALGFIFLLNVFFNQYIYLKNKIIIISIISVIIFSVLNLININNYKNQLNYYGRAVENNPETAALAYLNIGLAKAKSGNPKDAIEYFNKAARIKPDYSDAYSNRALAKTFLGDFSDAVMIDYDKAISINPKNASFYYNRGIAKSNRKDKNGAIIDYQKVLSIDPIHKGAANNLSFELNQLGKFNDCIEVNNKSIQLMPNYGEGYLNRGIAKFQLKDSLGACQDWHKALDLGVQNARDLVNKYCMLEFD
jgi:tetratricopeptide (TPR) repeat protein